MKDEEGFFWLHGRADEVLKVSCHRIGTREIEVVLVGTNNIVEAAVFGKPDPVKGESIVAYVTLRAGVEK